MHGPEATNNWSGGIVASQADSSFNSISGAWTIPDVEVPAGAPEGVNYIASVWIGLDGDGLSSDVLQAGCDAIVCTSGGAPQVRYSPWYQWCPGPSQTISNLPISAGDVLNCHISLQSGTLSGANVFLGNHTTGAGCTFSVAAPDGVTLSGNSAEWIVEAGGFLPPLAMFTPIEFNDCTAGEVGGGAIQSGTGHSIGMVDGVGQPLAFGLLVGATTVRVSHA